MTEHRINIMEPEIPSLRPQEVTAEKDKTPQVEYASVSERFVALLIDYGIIFFPLQLLARIPIKMLGDELDWWSFSLILLVMNLIFVLYETIFSCGDRVTLGKSLVGIAVVKKDFSGPISFFQAFLRAIGYYISTLLFLCGFVLAFFDDKHRALHDFFAGSVVVQIRQKAAWERWSLRTLGAVLLALFAWVGYTQYLGSGDFDKQHAIKEAREHLRKISILEEAHFVRYGKYTNDLLRLSLLSGDPVQFQRDTQAVLEPKGFKIGVEGDHYKISAVAKDKDHTRVVYEPQK